jgi:soluble lytic murein transglycosylase
VIAICDEALGDHRAAAAGYAAALEGLPLLADYLELRLARTSYFLHDGGAAEAHARRVSAGSIQGPEAELLVGDVLRGRGDPAAIAAHYARYLADRPNGMRRAEARFRLAEAYEATGRARPDALALYRAITVDAPLAAWAERAQARIDALVAGAPAGERAAATARSGAERIATGMVLFDAMRNEPSEAAFRAALAAPDLDAAGRCVASYHLAQSVFKQRDRTRAAPLFDDAAAACEQAANADLAVKAAYQAGRSYANIGKHDVARERYKTAEARGPGHSFADDARLRQAEEAEELGDDAGVLALLSTIPTTYPDGDMKAEALWRLAFRAWKRGDDAEAIRWLRAQIDAVPIDDNYWAEGQAQYWLGRALIRRGERDAGLAAYEAAIERYPMGYYALLALNRLREEDTARFAAVLGRIKTPAADDAPLAFAPRRLYGEPAFQRALELLRLGLGRDAEAELRQLGFTPPPGKKRVDDPDQIDRIWATVFLFHQAGRYGQSHWPTRWHVLDYKRRWPAGEHRRRWEIAYPPGWWGLLDEHAKKNGYPTELLISFVREESAFDPLMESFANAIGLTQMIAPTAKRFAKGTGLEVSRETLRDPVTNVTIGSRFLGFLYAKFAGRIALVVPSYNAGEGATTRPTSGRRRSRTTRRGTTRSA